MDQASQPASGSSQRHKLIKKLSHRYSRSSSGFEASHDAQPVTSDNRSSQQSLRRTPSAPPVRTSTRFSPRNPHVSQWPSVSPLPAPSEFAMSSPGPSNYQHTLPHRSSPNPAFSGSNTSTSKGTTDDLLGAPFDGASILNTLDSPKFSTHPSLRGQPPSLQRQNIPPPLARSVTDAKNRPGLRISRSFNTMDSSLMNNTAGRPMETGLMSPKRHSGEAQASKPPILRKKSGFTDFVTKVVGVQRKPTISAPENPVHVTHVGYDSSTGVFTVRSPVSRMVPALYFAILTLASLL